MSECHLYFNFHLAQTSLHYNLHFQSREGWRRASLMCTSFPLAKVQYRWWSSRACRCPYYAVAQEDLYGTLPFDQLWGIDYFAQLSQTSKSDCWITDKVGCLTAGLTAGKPSSCTSVTSLFTMRMSATTCWAMTTILSSPNSLHASVWHTSTPQS